MKRNIEIVVLSDLHLGTFGCHATELLSYLKSIKPEILILNGDIIDIWQLHKKYFPKEHLQIINKILKMASNGTKVYYITGNHDEKLRNFTDLKFSNLYLVDQLVLSIGGKKYWFFHGDVFDLSVNYTKFFAKMGAIGYDSLIRINHTVNNWRKYFGYERVSFSKKIKHSVKEAVNFIQNFEDFAIQHAVKNNFDCVVCGHIHRPIIKEVEANGKKIQYFNSGDWVENLTALEYNFGKWSLYEYDEDIRNFSNPRLDVPTKIKEVIEKNMIPEYELAMTALANL